MKDVSIKIDIVNKDNFLKTMHVNEMREKGLIVNNFFSFLQTIILRKEHYARLMGH